MVNMNSHTIFRHVVHLSKATTNYLGKFGKSDASIYSRVKLKMVLLVRCGWNPFKIIIQHVTAVLKAECNVVCMTTCHGSVHTIPFPGNII